MRAKRLMTTLVAIFLLLARSVDRQKALSDQTIDGIQTVVAGALMLAFVGVATYRGLFRDPLL